MHQILGHLPFVLLYIEDILVITENDEEHLVHLRKVFDILRANNLVLNQKCKLAEREIKFLGFILSTEDIRPNPAKVHDLLRL